MFNEVNKKFNISAWVKGIIIFILSTVFSVSFFAMIMYFTSIDREYTPLFGTVSVGFGIFLTSYMVSKKVAKKGYLVGFLISLAVFFINTIISLIIDDSAMTVNTLFHFIIYILSGVIGGVMGVNKNNNKKFI